MDKRSEAPVKVIYPRGETVVFFPIDREGWVGVQLGTAKRFPGRESLAMAIELAGKGFGLTSP